MTRSPRVDSACRFFPEIAATSPSTGAPCAGRDRDRAGPDAILQRCARAESRQGIARAHQGRHLGGRRRIDQGQYRDLERLADHRPRLCRDALFQAQPDQCRQRQEARAGVELSARNPPAASRRRRSWSTASCIRPRPGAWCTPSTPAPASSSGRFDPKVDREKGYKGCCDVVNRGVALWKGKVFRRRL